MEYNLKTLAGWINDFKAGDAVMDERISHWVNGLLDSERNLLLNMLTRTGIINYAKYFKN